MNFNKTEIIFILLTLFTINCDKITIELSDVHASYEISDIKNIVWTLESFEIGDQTGNLSSYAPFHLVYDDSLFFGDDGCNKYGGIYETNGDSVFPVDTWITEMACTNVNSFSWEHLTQPYRYQIQYVNGELMLYRDELIYIYRSNFLEDGDSLLVNKSWGLTSNVLITLVFDETRAFELEYDRNDSDNMGHGTVGGIYNIGDRNTILFYETNCGGSGVEWYNYLKRIISSSSYSIEDSLLILFNESDSTIFEFSVMD